MPQGKTDKTRKLADKKAKTSVANVNSNHLPCATRGKSMLSINEKLSSRSMRGNTVKSKVVLPSTSDINTKKGKSAVEFEEENEVINMEIDDGGHAEMEFAQDSNVESDPSDTEDNPSSSGSEEGEITNPSNVEHSENTQESTVTKSSLSSSPASSIQKKKRKLSRRSMEDKIDSLSQALFGLQEMIQKKGIRVDNAQKRA